MSKNDLTKVWQQVSKYMVIYALATWVVTQGGKLDLGVTIGYAGNIAALFGFLVCTPLFWLSLWLLSQFIDSYGGASYFSRIPQVGLEEELDFENPASRMYQRLILFIFLIVPISSITHFYRKILSVPVYDKSTNAVVDMWSPSPISVLVTDAYRFGENGGVTFFPFYQPLIMTILFAVIWVYLLFVLWKIFRVKVRLEI